MRAALLLRAPLFLVSLLLGSGCGEFGLVAVGEEGGIVGLTPQGQIRFGEVSPSGRAVVEEAVISASGDAAVTVTDAWIESEDAVFFTGDTLPFPRTIEPGAELPLSLRFQPDSAGTYHGTLVVEASDGTLLERQLVGAGCDDRDHDGDC